MLSVYFYEAAACSGSVCGFVDGDAVESVVCRLGAVVLDTVAV